MAVFVRPQRKNISYFFSVVESKNRKGKEREREREREKRREKGT